MGEKSVVREKLPVLVVSRVNTNALDEMLTVTPVPVVEIEFH